MAVLRLALPTLLVLLVGAGCTALPESVPQQEEFHIGAPGSGEIARLAEDVRLTFGDSRSGFLMIPKADEALMWRLAAADLAVSSIDIQYFIWQGDESAGLLFERVLQAANRGVKVRMLVDALVLSAGDDDIGAVNRHPNISLKIYNPGKYRGTVGSMGSFMLNFKELNRRMHNKMFVVDNSLAIIGGRNIGNPYFGLSKKYNFADLDLLIVGPMVSEISSAFDTYWNSDQAYPGNLLADRISEEEATALLEEFDAESLGDPALLQAFPVKDHEWKKEWSGLLEKMSPGEGHFLQDKPVHRGGEEHRLIDMIRQASGHSTRELLITSPYLIPGDWFFEDLERLRSEGVTVRIITGGLDSNNHTAAHAHYRKYRKRILQAGAELYEFRSQPSEKVRSWADVAPVRSGFISLHAKAMSADDERCFIGSLNLDPRAVDINTENGAYIESTGLCSKLGDGLRQAMHPDNAWQVTLDDNGRLSWSSSLGTVTRQPSRGGMQRLSDFLYRLLPIEKQL